MSSSRVASSRAPLSSLQQPSDDAAAANGTILNASSLKRRAFLAQSIAASLLTAPKIAYGDDTNTIDPSINLPKITSKVYLDIKLPTYKEPRRLIIGLFGEDVPKAAGNFQTLCTNTDGPSYSGTNFYRVISDTSIQGGAVGNSSGKSGISSFENGQPFEPDNFSILHTKKGLVSGVRNPNGTMDSRFFIQTEDDAGWADGRYAAFGIVLDDGSKGGGIELVKKISRVEVKTPQNSPKDPILIVGCGML
jgi:cyclophilin family peptidyl-prolyl cis-trans isomerase